MSAFTTPVTLRARLASPLRFAVCPVHAPRHARPTRPTRAAPAMVLYDRDTKTSSSSEVPSVTIRITGNNITITDALRVQVLEKLSKVTRRFNTILSKMDVHLTVDHNPSIPNRHKAEVVAFSGKTILRTEVRSDDMYTAIDAVEERIARTIRKFKERRESRSSKARDATNPVGSPSPMDEDDEDETAMNAQADDVFRDVYHDKIPGVPAVTDVVRRKVFPMPMQTVEEAVLCCEYVDHPWYLFRNAATKEISLVYRRNHGGYGLIEPSNPDIVDGEPL